MSPILLVSELYLTTEQVRFAEAFNEFPGLCMLYYGLYPAHYSISSQFSWDAMVRYTPCTM